MVENLCGDRLLVIDDEPALVQVVKRIAEASGFDVVVTSDPAVFANTARVWKPTVIMLLAGTVPIVTFIVERWVTRRFINPALGEGPGRSQPTAPASRATR